MPHPYTNLPKESSDPNPLNKGDIHLLGLAGSVVSRDLVQHHKYDRGQGTMVEGHSVTAQTVSYFCPRELQEM